MLLVTLTQTLLKDWERSEFIYLIDSRKPNISQNKISDFVRVVYRFKFQKTDSESELIITIRTDLTQFDIDMG